MARAAKREETVAKRRKVMEAEDGHGEEKELLFGLVEDDKVCDDPREEYVDAFDEHENDSEGAWRRVAMAKGCKDEPVYAFDEHEHDSEGAWRRVAMGHCYKYEALGKRG